MKDGDEAEVFGGGQGCVTSAFGATVLYEKEYSGLRFYHIMTFDWIFLA
jgi:hypothetical protein